MLKLKSFILKLSIVYAIVLFNCANGQVDEFDYNDVKKDSSKSWLQSFSADYDEWKKLWPPIDDDKKPYSLDVAGHIKWENDLREKQDEWKNKKYGARPYPFCVDGYLDKEKKRFHPYLENFRDILNQHKSFQRVKKPVIATKEGGSPDKNGLLDKIEFKSIISPDGPNPSKFGIGISKMRQWMHIFIQPRKALAGLIVQGISGPVGVPFGEFRADFDCYDENNKKLEVTTFSPTIVPCKFRPRASIRHPNVYVYGGNGTLSKPKFFRMHFNYENVKCCNAPRMQFLILAVEKFGVKPVFEAILTQAYELNLAKDFDQVGVGVPYPFYKEFAREQPPNSIPEMPFMRCFDQTEDKLITDDDRSNRAIYYNKEYDKCILTGEDVQDDSSCPPGPFLCDEDGQMSVELFQDLLTERIKDTSDVPCNGEEHTWCEDPADTEPLLRRTTPAPITTTTTPATTTTEFSPTDEAKVSLWFTSTVQHVFRRSRSFHAFMMTISCMILVSISTFISRYFKETTGLNHYADNGCLGTGKWLCAHIFIFYAATIFMWVGMIEVMSVRSSPIHCEDYIATEVKENCESRNDFIIVHEWLGILSVLFFHLALITGWFRSTKRGLVRIFFVYFHSFFGYAGKLLANLCVIVLAGTESVCSDVIIVTILLEVANIFIFFVGYILQRIEDMHLKVKQRQMFPVPEAIKIIEDSPFNFCRNQLINLSWVIYFLLYGLVISSYILRLKGDSVKESTADVLVDLSGLFGKDCKVPSIETEHRAHRIQHF